jgi:hypothetical protein
MVLLDLSIANPAVRLLYYFQCSAKLAKANKSSESNSVQIVPTSVYLQSYLLAGAFRNIFYEHKSSI